jgi:dUTP pyrophosphatase
MDKDKIYFAKVKEDAIIPSKRDEDGAYDIYASFDEDHITIAPHSSKLIPTGIVSAFDKKWRIVFQERGSTGVVNLKVNAGLIDSGYRNEWFVCLYNGNDAMLIIDKKIDEKEVDMFSIKYPYRKAICQAKIQEVPVIEIEETTQEIIDSFESERGLGMLGSSQK